MYYVNENTYDIDLMRRWMTRSAKNVELGKWNLKKCRVQTVNRNDGESRAT